MRVLAVTVALALFPCSIVFATPCQVGSLQDYIDLGGSGCSIEDKTVSGFLDFGALGFATPILPSEVTVTPLATPGNPGLTFDFSVTANAGDLLESLFAFSVALLPGGMPIEAVGFSLAGSDVVPDGANTALACLGTLDPSCPTDVIILFDIGTDSELTGLSALPPAATLDLVMDVVVDGGSFGSAALSSATIRFQEATAVPEPTLLLSFGAGLLALGVIRRRSRPAIEENAK